MASKSDLLEAQSFSRRRLLTAFVSGAPGGKELEPAKPLRAVVISLALTVAVILGGVFFGLVQPGLPPDWKNGRLVIAKDTGARYVSVNGVLHPVINTASARLLIPSSEFAIVTTDSSAIAGIRIGAPLGIVGAPDALPRGNALVNSGWTACVTDTSGVAVTIAATPGASVTRDAAVVENDGARFVVAGGLRYPVDPENADAVLRAAGINALAPLPVSSAWLNLFAPGAPLTPLIVADAGTPIPGDALPDGSLPDGPLSIGEVIHTSGSAADQRFLVQPDGSLAALSPLAWQLYQLGSGKNLALVREVPAAAVAQLKTAAQAAGSQDWPHTGFTALPSAERACALLSADGARSTRTVLASAPVERPAARGITVQPGHGALILSAGRGAGSAGMLTLIDATGTAYALPGGDSEIVKRLGYTQTDVGAVEQSWIALLQSGPELTSTAAGHSPSSSSALGRDAGPGR